MRLNFYTLLTLCLFILNHLPLLGQGPDCVDALVICTDGAQSFNPTGPGINDFANPNNSNGCLLSLEDQSAWYYFEFQADMPPNSIIEFTLNPDGGFGEDYDFAIFGPNVSCDALGSPLRCSYAASACGFCPQTGLGMGATDNSEGAGGDGFVAPIVVNPGQGFFLLVDNWLGSSTGFSLDWGGSAAPYLNCNANPTCELELMMGPSQTSCAGGLPISLFPIVTGNTGAVNYVWSSPDGGMAFINDPTSPSPTITIPQGTNPGTYTFNLTVTDDLCDQSGTITITVTAVPPPSIVGNLVFCEGSATVLSVVGNYTSYMWSNGSTSQNAIVSTPGPHTVTVTDNSGCSAMATVNVIQQPAPTPFIDGQMEMCLEGAATFSVFSPGAVSYQWSNNETSPTITVFTPGPYFVTVTDAFGCQGTANWVVNVIESPAITITGDPYLCDGESTTLTAQGVWSAYNWSNNQDGQSITVSEEGDYSVTVVDENGCLGAETFSVFEVPSPTPTISGETTICQGESTTLNAGGGYDSYLWQNNTTNQTFSTNQAGTYSVTVTNADGCEGVAQVEVVASTITPPPITGDLALCASESGQLTAGDGYASYLWADGETSQTIDIDAAGTYSVTVTNDEGCEATASVTVDENPDPAPTISGTVDFCEGESTTLDAGSGYSSYLWSNGDTTQTITANSSGTQSVTVTNEFGCTATAQLLVTEVANPVASISGEDEICEGESTMLSAGGNYDSYLWSTGDTTQQIDVSTSGTITLTVQNAIGCQDETTFTVTQFDNPTPSISGALEFCEGLNTTLDAGPGFASYSWSNGSSQQSIDVTVADTFYVTVTNASGCAATTSVIVEENATPEPMITGNLSICNNESAVLNAGAGFASYNWSNGSDQQQITVDVEDTYSVTVIDANGCEGTATHDVAVHDNPSPVISGIMEICPGGSTELDAGSYSMYQWSDGTNGQFLTADMPGDFGVTVTDANGCQGTATTSVAELPAPEPDITGALDFCTGTSTLLSVDAYSAYEWSDGSTTQDLSVNTPGQYLVTVTAANGCIGLDSVEVIENPLPTVNISGELAFCEGDSSILDAGSGFASYTWNNGASSQTLFANDMSAYSVTVTDGNGCSNEDVVNTTINALPEPTISGDFDFCDGESSILQGSPGFAAYRWDDGSTNTSLTVDATNTYGLTVIDANGCVGETSVDVEELALPVPVIGGVPSLCDGESTVLDVGPDYSDYLWSTNSTSATINVATPGIYSVTVTDADGCQGETSLDVQFNDLPTVAITGDNQICDGEISTLSAGTFAAYQWSDGSTEPTLDATAANTYSVTVTDDNGCQNNTTFTLQVDALPQPAIDGLFGFCEDTSSTLTASSGFSSYLWGDGSTNTTLEVNTTGNYGLTVTDVNGCQGETAVDVEAYELPEPVIGGVPSLCNGESTTLNLVDAYSEYLWSTNTTAPTIDVGTPGVYGVTVTDANGCQGETSLDVQFNDLPTVVITGDDEICNGEISTLSAGTFVAYQWSDGSTDPTLDATIANTYSVTVTDDNGCQNNTSFDLAVNPLPEPEIDGTFAFCEDVTSTLSTTSAYTGYLWEDGSSNATLEVSSTGNYGLTVTDANGCQGQTDVDIQVFELPTPVIEDLPTLCVGETASLNLATDYSAYNWSTNNSASSIDVTASGQYGVTVTDDNGCQNVTSIDVLFNDLPIVAITGDDQICAGEVSTLSAGMGFSAYEWSDGSVNPTLDANVTDIYGVTVTDGNGCQNNTTFELTVNPNPQPEIDGDFAFCEDVSSTLSATATYAGYLWEGGSTNPTLEVNSTGNYGLTVTDDNGCIGETAVDIQVFELPQPSISGDPQYCAGLSTVLNAEGGDFDYLWSTSVQTQSATINAPGTVSVTVTDENGCMAEASIDVIEHPLPTPVISGTPSFCAGLETALSVNAGYSDYQWSTATSGSILTVNTEGNYEVTVTDINGCVNSTSVFVEELPLPVFAISGQEFFCEDDNTIISVPDGFAAYSWSDGSQSSSITVEIADQYIVTVTNEFGCIDEAAIDIAEIPLPIANAGAMEVITCNNPTVTLGGNNPYPPNSFQFIWDGPGITSSNRNEEEPEVDVPGDYTLTIINTQYNCSSEPSTVIIDENTQPPVVALQVLDTIDCVTNTVLVDGSASSGGSDIAYQWYLGNDQIIQGATNSTIIVDDPDTYSLLVVNTITGCESMDSIEVHEDVQYPIANAGLSMHLDCNTTTVSLDGSASQAGSAIRYTWSSSNGNILSGNGTTSPTVNQPGQYVLLVEDIFNGCSNFDTVTVTQDIEAPIADAGAPGHLDCNTSEVTLNGSGSSVGPEFIYNWTASTDATFNSAESTILIDYPGTFTLLVTDISNGCSSLDVVVVTEDTTQPTDLVLTIDDPTCFGDDDGSVIVAETVGGTPPFMYSFDGGPYSNRAVFSSLEAGIYELTVQDLNGCEFTTTVDLQPGNDLAIDLGDDQYINLGESATINAQVNIPSDAINNISWNAQDSLECNFECLRQIVTPFLTSTYAARVVDENGCVSEDFITVFVNRPYEIFVPNAFSPNNDGNNDKFMVFAGEDVAKINKFQVFSRWGEMVFEVYNFLPNDPNYGWDGAYRAKPLNNAVFVYVVEAVFIDGETRLFKGSVTLMR